MFALIENQLLLAIAVLCCLAVFLLFAVVLLLYQLNGRLAGLSSKIARSIRSLKLDETEGSSQNAESQPGTAFDRFLSEDPQRRAFVKKEQFKAYRIWRKEKGLNWDAKEQKEIEDEKKDAPKDEKED